MATTLKTSVTSICSEQPIWICPHTSFKRIFPVSYWQCPRDSPVIEAHYSQAISFDNSVSHRAQPNNSLPFSFKLFMETFSLIIGSRSSDRFLFIGSKHFMVFLGIPSYQKDLQLTAAEVIYGRPIHLSFHRSQRKSLDNNVCGPITRPMSVQNSATPRIFVLQALATCSHGFISRVAIQYFLQSL